MIIIRYLCLYVLDIYSLSVYVGCHELVLMIGLYASDCAG